jgi:hypothetical protein
MAPRLSPSKWVPSVKIKRAFIGLIASWFNNVENSDFETFARIHFILKVSGVPPEADQVKALSVPAESSKLIADSQKK